MPVNITKYLGDLRSPVNNSPLQLNNNELVDSVNNIFPIINGIPRFVTALNYADSFGFQWNIFQQTQVDRSSGNTISSERFYKNSGWSNEELKGKKLLEVGSGAGRFTEVLLKTGTQLYSIDYSNAVEANWKTNGTKDFFLAQANIYELPFIRESFDYILCFGVIQHTPDVKTSFLSMVDFLKPGGEIAIDVYSKNWKTIFLTKYWVRPITKRMSKKRLLNIIKWYVPKWLPISTALIKIPYFGKFFAQMIPICNYSKQFPFLNKQQLTEWAVLDTFDMLSPEYDNPQSLVTLRKWATELNLKIIYCGKGDNGYVLRAKKNKFMCGISGFNFKSEDLIKDMNCSLDHRGPDGKSFYIQENLSLGHNRLSIIDLSAAGSQPMFYKFGGKEVCIVYNGEIYNYLEIKHKLSKLGYVFNTHTDTEVIMAAYLAWGENCVTDFNGMWSFCLYDIAGDKLLCSRDRLGVKPFYYYYHQNKFIFSSELKSILKHEYLKLNCTANINKHAVELFFALGYIPAPHTIYNQVSKLNAGTNLVFNLKNSSISSIYSHYKVAEKQSNHNKKELLEEGKEILRDAVKLRMRSDVPVGAFLSGGLDSSTVVGEMKHFTELKNLHTFSIGFENKLFDESMYINLVKDYFETNHHHHIFSEADFSAGWKNYSEIFDEPFADYSSLASNTVCHLAHSNVKVVLSGDGGDEIFGGYPLYNTGHILEKSRIIPRSVRKFLYSATSGIKKFDKRISKLNETLRLSLLDKKEYHSQVFSENRYKPRIYREWSIERLGNALDICENNLSEALRVYDLLYNTLPDNYLVKVDRTSMANSIEVRSPFLDYRFIKYAQQIPPDLKVSFRNNKILMRELIKDIIPSKIIYRNKMGFTPPIHEWFYKTITSNQLKLYWGYLEIFSNDLHFFYQKLFESDKTDYMRDFYMIKLAIFGNWMEHWIINKKISNEN